MILNSGKYRCKLCVGQIVKPDVEPSENLWYTYKEGARIAKCKFCDQLHLKYFVDYRGDIMDYTCQISEQERDMILASTVQHQFVIDVIQGKKVYYSTQWSSERKDVGVFVPHPM